MTLLWQDASSVRRMTMLNRFLWGGLGGLAPILATFLILEATTIAVYLEELHKGGSMLTLIGYTVRVVGLFVVGGLWAGLHKSEADPKKLFQLGIVAPAMITGMISASNVGTAVDEVETARLESPAAVARLAERPTVGATTTRSLMAQREEPQTDQTGRPRPSDPEPVRSFIRGLLGR